MCALVTGVQTCALPISRSGRGLRCDGAPRRVSGVGRHLRRVGAADVLGDADPPHRRPHRGPLPLLRDPPAGGAVPGRATVVASVVYVVLHHSVVTLLAPESVFSTSYAQNKPLLWAGIHAGFVVGGRLVQVSGWRYAERARHVAEAQRAQDEATRREALEARVAAAQEARPRAGQCPPPQPEERR